MTEKITIVKILPTKVWIESDMMGAKHVVLQHEGHDAFTYCSFHYGYGYTSNSGVHSEAVSMAKALGAEDPIEYRSRDFHWPTIDELKEEIAGLQTLLNDQEERARKEAAP